MDFGWLAPLGASLVAVSIYLLWNIARNVEKSRQTLESIRALLLSALYDDDQRYSQVRRIGDILQHSNRNQ